MEPTAALTQIFEEDDYNDSDGDSSEEEEGYPECVSYEADMLDRYQVRYWYFPTMFWPRCVLVVRLFSLEKNAVITAASMKRTGICPYCWLYFKFRRKKMMRRRTKSMVQEEKRIIWTPTMTAFPLKKR